MGKGSGSTLAILALIVGVGGLGFGIYTYFTVNQTIASLQGDLNDIEDVTDEISVHRTYSDSTPASYTSPSEDSYVEIPNLGITFTVDSGESVYFLFTCRASLTATSGVSRMRFWVKIDGVRIDDSEATVGANGYSSTSNFYSVVVQYTATSLSSGSHNVVIEMRRECAGPIDHCYLFVQTFKS